MQAHSFVWGGGEYICLGSNMALMEIKVALARVLGRFFVRVESKQTHRDMEMCDHFVIAPKGGKGLLVFEMLE